MEIRDIYRVYGIKTCKTFADIMSINGDPKKILLVLSPLSINSLTSNTGPESFLLIEERPAASRNSR